MNSYLLKMFYRKKTQPEYQTQEFLLNGTPNTIDDIVKEELKQFDDVNKKFGYKVEAYNLFEFIKGDNLK